MTWETVSAFLSSFGPYGALIGAALLVVGPRVISFVKARWPNLKLPTLPKPGPDLVPLTPAEPRPIDVILNALLGRIRKALPDADAEQHVMEILAREMVYTFSVSAEKGDRINLR